MYKIHSKQTTCTTPYVLRAFKFTNTKHSSTPQHKYIFSTMRHFVSTLLCSTLLLHFHGHWAFVCVCCVCSSSPARDITILHKPGESHIHHHITSHTHTPQPPSSSSLTMYVCPAVAVLTIDSGWAIYLTHHLTVARCFPHTIPIIIIITYIVQCRPEIMMTCSLPHSGKSSTS